MKKEDAIKYLQQLYPNGGHCWLDEQRIEAIGMAVKALQEEPISNPIDFEKELYKAFGQVKDFTLGMRIAKWFYDMGKNGQEPVSEDEIEKQFKAGDVVVYVSRHPAYSGLYLLGNPNDLSIGYSNANEPYQIALRNCTVASEDERKQFMQELDINGYKWNEDILRIEKEEPVSEELENELNKYIKDYFTIDREQLDRFGIEEKDYMYSMDKSDMLALVEHFTKWQKKQMMKDVVEGKVIANGMGNPILHLWDKGKHLIDKKVKVIIIKED